MPKGEMRRNVYEPGKERVKSIPAEEGDYTLDLEDYGKPGLKGWKVKNPKKFPNRMVRFSMRDTEDEVTGKEKKVFEFFSASPAAFFKVADFAAAVGYPESLDLPQPSSPRETAEVRECCEAIEALLKWVKDQEKPVNARISIEEYKGKEGNKVADWLPSDEEVVADDAEDEEEVKPKKRKAKAAPSDEDTEEDDADEDADDSDSDDDDAEPDEDDDSDDADSDDDEAEEVKPAKGKVKVSQKVLPLGTKKTPKPAPKKAKK